MFVLTIQNKCKEKQKTKKKLFEAKKILKKKKKLPNILVIINFIFLVLSDSTKYVFIK